MQKLSVLLKNLRFHAYHGWHAEEKKSGNDFDLDIEVKFFPHEKVVKDINHTVNYADLFKLVENRMQRATPLLETVVMEIVEEITSRYPEVINVSCRLIKVTAPIPGMDGSVGVAYSWQKEN